MRWLNPSGVAYMLRLIRLEPKPSVTLLTLRAAVDRRLVGLWCIPSVKVTFELPPSLVQRLRTHIPSGERSRFVADLISKKLRTKGNALEHAAQKANNLHNVNRDMKDWEALNEHED